MKSITVTLKKIICHKSNETGKDELFVQTYAKDESHGSIPFLSVSPKNQKGYWSIGNGDVLELDEVLFADFVRENMQIKITFIEEDVTGIFVHKAIQELIDDFIGEIIIDAKKDGTETISAGKHTKLKSQDRHFYEFALAGSGASYDVTLEIR